MRIGFSTGSLAPGNADLGLRIVSGLNTVAIELSALRETELAPLVELIDSLDLCEFSYVSFHAPGRLMEMTEAVGILLLVARRRWPIVVHPDVISNCSLWQPFGEFLCVENMDKRKAIGRTAKELEYVFDSLPDATLCFDIGHARQIDPTMSEARAILKHHGSRLRQVHLSLVASNSMHERLNFESIQAFRRVAHLIPRDTPIILESPVRRDQIAEEISRAESLFTQGVGVE